MEMNIWRTLMSASLCALLASSFTGCKDDDDDDYSEDKDNFLKEQVLLGLDGETMDVDINGLSLVYEGVDTKHSIRFRPSDWSKRTETPSNNGDYYGDPYNYTYPFKGVDKAKSSKDGSSLRLKLTDSGDELTLNTSYYDGGHVYYTCNDGLSVKGLRLQATQNDRWFGGDTYKCLGDGDITLLCTCSFEDFGSSSLHDYIIERGDGLTAYDSNDDESYTWQDFLTEYDKEKCQIFVAVRFRTSSYNNYN